MARNIFQSVFRKFVPKRNNSSLYTKELLNGRGFEIGDHTYGHPVVLEYGEKSRLIVGRYCSIAEGVTIFLGGEHRTDWVSTYPFNVLNENFPEATKIEGHPRSKGDVVIGNDVWVGTGATIMSGVTIGDGAVIGAKTVVTKNVGPYEIVGGNPAKHIRFRFSEEQIKQLLKIKWWDWSTEVINSKIKGICNTDIEDFLNHNS